MGRIFVYIFLACLVSTYYFSFGLTFLPPSVNSKLILSVLGLVAACFHVLQRQAIIIEKKILISIIFAVLFSIICLVSTDINRTTDFTYATYIVSFSVWCFAAYFVCVMIKWGHGKIDILLLTKYLAVVCVAQCITALLIDAFPIFKFSVDTYIDQGQGFLQRVDRLYGIGASLDNAGVRFSIVLVLISGVIAQHITEKGLSKSVILLALAFLFITVVGNMISRTTIVGTAMGTLCAFIIRGPFSQTIRVDSLKFWATLLIVVAVFAFISVYYYRTNGIFYSNVRFAFEGFFNFVEHGEWRTASTDKLTNTMWVWPETDDLRSWIIGKGLFDNWVFGTDIGYCRFVLYCGLVGLTVFSLFFIYNGLIFMHIYPEYRLMFLFFIALTFIIWVKVSTDIFIIYALLYGVLFLNRTKVQA